MQVSSSSSKLPLGQQEVAQKVRFGAPVPPPIEESMGRLASRFAPTPDEIKQQQQQNQVKGFFSKASGVIGTVSGGLLPFSNLLTAASTFTNTFFGHKLRLIQQKEAGRIQQEVNLAQHEQKQQQNYQVAASAAAVLALGILGAAKGMAWVNEKRLAQKLKGTYRTIDREKIKEYLFKDVVGHDDVKQIFQGEILTRIQHPEFFPKDSRFAILHGEPGTGKTLLAKCLANEAGIPFVEVHLSALSEKNVKELRLKLEQYVAQNGPTVILLDELDSIPKREVARSGDIKVMNEILQLLDGVTSLKNAFVIGTTNRHEALDKGLLSRACNVIAVNASDQAETFERYLQKAHPLQQGDFLKLIPPNNFDMAQALQASEGFTGRAVKNSVNNLIDRVILENIDSLKEQREAAFRQHVPPPPSMVQKLTSFFIESPPPAPPVITYKIPFTESQLLSAIKQAKGTETDKVEGIQTQANAHKKTPVAIGDGWSTQEEILEAVQQIHSKFVEQGVIPANGLKTKSSTQLPVALKTGRLTPFQLMGANGVSQILPEINAAS